VERIEAHRGEVDSHVAKAHSLMAAFSDSNGQRFQALERMVAEFVVSKDDELASLREQVASLKAAVDSHLDGTAASLSANTVASGQRCDSVTSAAQENAKMMRSAMSQGVAQVCIREHVIGLGFRYASVSMC
jgi:septation ring formation regulator EzrA